MTWPLVLHMRDSVVGEIGDNIYFIFLIRWYQKAWFELGISPFFHPWLNYPQGWNLASTDTSLATTLFGLPVSLLCGPTFGYNFAMLVTFVLSGWAMYLLGAPPDRQRPRLAWWPVRSTPFCPTAWRTS